MTPQAKHERVCKAIDRYNAALIKSRIATGLLLAGWFALSAVAGFSWATLAEARASDVSAAAAGAAGLALVGITGLLLHRIWRLERRAFAAAFAWQSAAVAIPAWLVAMASGASMLYVTFVFFAATALNAKVIQRIVTMERAIKLASDREKLQGFLDQVATEQSRITFRVDLPDAIAEVKARVIGQDAIVEESVRMTFRRGQLVRPNKPLSVMLFVGSTGAGKTELAKTLADTLFGDDRLIRVDCNEMTEAHHADRLVGAPPGYAGSDQGGWLVREIERMGSGVILFDEIEKAHPAVLKIVMGLMDEGRITERSTSQTAKAEGFLIVLTSNAAQAEIARLVGTENDAETLRKKVRAELINSKHWAPEQLARVDEVFAFGRLNRRALAEIVALFLGKFGKQAGVDVVSVQTELLIDLVLRAEQRVEDGGVREVVRAVERIVIDGLLDVRMSGASKAAIWVRDDKVVVEPAEEAQGEATA